MKKLLMLFASMIAGVGLIAQTVVYTPALSSPANEAMNQMPDVVLSWAAVAGSVNLQYQVQMDTTPAFNSPLLVDVTQTLVTGYKNNQLLFSTTYYWRVRAMDLGVTTPWSELWHFTVFNSPDPSKPSTGDQEANVNLEWKSTVGTPSVPISGISYFQYQVDTSLNFNSALLQEGMVAGDIFKVATTMLRFGTQYHWRVRAGHPIAIGAWSEPLTFSVLDEVDLNTPNNNATNQNLDVLLKWKTLGGIVAYDYQLSQNEDFTDLVFFGETTELSVNAEFTMFGVDYWWRVRARHLEDTTGWSEVRKLTTINTVILQTPSNAQVNVETSPTVYWEAQTGVTGFQLQIATESTFANPVWDVKPLASERFNKVTKKLAGQTLHYWRMRAFSNGTQLADTTEWSEPWTFTTGFPQGIGETTEATLSIYPNPASVQTVITVHAAAATSATLEVMDLVGKTRINQTLSLRTGENTIPTNLSTLRKGLYIVRLTIGNDTMNRKLVVE